MKANLMLPKNWVAKLYTCYKGSLKDSMMKGHYQGSFKGFSISGCEFRPLGLQALGFGVVDPRV